VSPTGDGFSAAIAFAYSTFSGSLCGLVVLGCFWHQIRPLGWEFCAGKYAILR